MRGGFDRIIKETDTLTYNSRSVLNALIRSTVVAGTASGYTVTRAGYEITLDRVDIYRLYKFFEQWGISNYDVTLFDSILSEQNSVPVVDDNGNELTRSTTDALVKHSKILFLNNDTVGSVDDDSHWINLVKESNNPKLISNASPIPLNLRTPIFDENLATTRYNQHETYMFPFAYYSVDLLGYSGDNNDHHLDGKSWTISADAYISLDSDAVAMGGVNSSDSKKTKARRNHNIDSNGNAYEVTYSTAFGYATQARAKYSTAGGLSSLVPRGATGAVAIGDQLIATDAGAVAIGGSYNKAVGIGSGILGGNSNIAAGVNSGIIGVNCATGGIPDKFKFPSSDANAGTCIVAMDTCEGSIVSGSSLGRNLIAIVGNVGGRYYIGDTVAVHSFTAFYNDANNIEYYATHGDAYKTQQLQVTSVQYLDPTVYPSNINKGKTLITLSGDVTGMGVVDGGYVSRIRDKNDNTLGYASVALNNATVAIGNYQTVVGSYNYLVEDALFIVGNGNADNTSRSNSLEVYRNGLSVFSTIHNELYPKSSITSIYYDFNYIGMHAKVQHADFSVTDDKAYLSLGSYIGLYASTKSTDNYNMMLSSYIKPIIIRTGASREYRQMPVISDILISSHTNVIIEADSNIFLDSSNYISLDAGTRLVLNWGETLELYGNTFGALPTTDDQFSHYVGVDYINVYTINNKMDTLRGIANSGFYDVLNDNTGNSFTGSYGNYPIMKSCQLLTIGDKLDSNYHAWKLMFPSIPNYNKPIPNIGVMYNELDSQGSEKSISAYRGTRLLAYQDEIGGQWNDYISYSQKYSDPSDIFSSIVYRTTDTNTSSEITDIDAVNSLIRSFNYTIIGNTAIIKLHINTEHFTKLSNYMLSDNTTIASLSNSVSFDLIIDTFSYTFTTLFSRLSVDGCVSGLASNAQPSSIIKGTSSIVRSVSATYGMYQTRTTYGNSHMIRVITQPNNTPFYDEELVFTLIGELRNG